MDMGTDSSHGYYAPVAAQAGVRDCCPDAAQITNQWIGKPLPRVVQHETLGFSPHQVIPARSYHPVEDNLSWQQRGSPVTSSQFPVLRI